MNLLSKLSLSLVSLLFFACGPEAELSNIMTGSVNAELTTKSQIFVDINSDGQDDIGFEIINLLESNGPDFPADYDTFAVRVLPLQSNVLDNSTYGYPDALEEDALIDSEALWSSGARNALVLGTFLDAGQFKGQGWRYLGFRLNEGEQTKYGWIRLDVSDGNQSINIGDFGYNNTDGESILAGQTE